MSTAITPFQGARPAFLAAVEAPNAINDAFAAGIKIGGGLPALSIRGRAFRVKQGDKETTLKDGEYELKSIRVAVIAAREGKSKVLYNSAWVQGQEPKEPDCSSADGLKPDAHIENPVAEACATCPKNAWGSGKNGTGKACSDYKRIIIVPVDANGGLAQWEGKVQPFRLHIPATSLIPFGKYVNELTKYKVPVNAAITVIRMRDTEYPSLRFEPGGYLSEDGYRQAVELAAGEDVADAASLVGDAPRAAEPAPEVATPPAPTAPVKAEPVDELEEAGIEQLRTWAKELNIPEWDKRRSPTLRSLIREARAKSTPPPGPDPVVPPPVPGEDLGDLLKKWEV